MTRHDWQETAFVLAIGALMLFALFVMFILLPHPFEEADVTGFYKEPLDLPLLTPQEKTWAKESGVGSYRINGVTYVDYSLSSDYWEDQ